MICFCFLIVDRLPYGKLWEAYLKGSDHKALVHSKVSSPSNVPSSFHRTSTSGILEAGHGDIRQVEALLTLLKEGLSLDPEISHFIFLSESCLPVRSSQALEKELQSKQNKSILSWSHPNPQGEHGLRFRHIRAKYIQEMKLSPDNWLYHPTWIVLCRNHARLLTQTPRLAFFLKAFSKVPFVDEHFFGTVLWHLMGPQAFQDQVVRTKTTFVNWRDYERTPDGRNHPKTYHQWDPALWSTLQSQGYWFARKFKCKVEMNDLKIQGFDLKLDFKNRKNQKEESKSKRWVWFLVGGLFILLVLLLIMWFYKNRSKV